MLGVFSGLKLAVCQYARSRCAARPSGAAAATCTHPLAAGTRTHPPAPAMLAAWPSGSASMFGCKAEAGGDGVFASAGRVVGWLAGPGYHGYTGCCVARQWDGASDWAARSGRAGVGAASHTRG